MTPDLNLGSCSHVSNVGTPAWRRASRIVFHMLVPIMAWDPIELEYIRCGDASVAHMFASPSHVKGREQRSTQ
jgi:hypothetical protein